VVVDPAPSPSVTAEFEEQIRDIARTWATVVHRANLPRVQEELTARAGLSLDRVAFRLLNELAAADGMRLSDLAQREGTDLSTVSRQIKHCEEAGLVQRKNDPGDMRAVQLTLTESGRDALERLRRVREQMFLDVLASWPEAERRHMARVFTRFVHDFVDYLGAIS